MWRNGRIFKEKKINTFSFPAACTKYIQPLDVSIFKSFKSKLEELKNKYILDNIINRTKAGNINNPGRECEITWNSKTWSNIDEGIICNHSSCVLYYRLLMMKKI